MSVNSMTESNMERNDQAREAMRAPDRHLRPAVNIIELQEELALAADIPGAARESIEVHVERGILTISAPVAREMPGRRLYTEFELAPYFRQFQIPDNIAQEKTMASFQNGVLTLRLQKPEVAKPRRIEIKS